MSRDSEADQMESFLFISCPAGLGLVRRPVAGQWRGVTYSKDML